MNAAKLKPLKHDERSSWYWSCQVLNSK